MFKRKRTVEQDRFDAGVELVKDLSKAEKDKMLAGLDLVWQGYEKVRTVKTREEKEFADIEKAEREADFIETKK